MLMVICQHGLLFVAMSQGKKLFRGRSLKGTVFQLQQWHRIGLGIVIDRRNRFRYQSTKMFGPS